MPTACSAAPLTHHAFRRRQRSVELESLSYKKLRVAWTDLGEGEPDILLHGIPTGCKARKAAVLLGHIQWL